MTGTDGHPEVAEISALTEGVLSPARTADVREHLADCELCEDVRSSLDEIRGMLGTLPGPVRMPADVAGRIDAALAAEALLDATAPETTAAVSRETAPEESAAQVTAASARTAVSRETTPRTAPGRPAGHPRATTGPGKQAPMASGPRPRTRRARRWPQALLGTACAAAVIGVGSFFLQQGGDDDPSAGPTAPGSSQSTPSTLAVGDLGAHVRDLLHSSKGAESRGMSAQSSPETTLRGSGVIAPGCVLEGIGRTEQALATRQEKYQGEDAYLVVLPHPTDASLVDAYMVAAACDTTSPSVPGKVLMNKSFPRD